jgi:hypothetical protein
VISLGVNGTVMPLVAWRQARRVPMIPTGEEVPEGTMNETDAAWAEAKVRELLRDAVAWLLVLQMAELGVVPRL